MGRLSLQHPSKYHPLQSNVQHEKLENLFPLQNNRSFVVRYRAAFMLARRFTPGCRTLPTSASPPLSDQHVPHVPDAGVHDHSHIKVHPAPHRGATNRQAATTMRSARLGNCYGDRPARPL